MKFSERDLNTAIRPDDIRRAIGQESLVHYDGCWRDPRHYYCAVQEIRSLRNRIVKMERAEKGVSEGKAKEGTPVGAATTPVTPLPKAKTNEPRPTDGATVRRYQTQAELEPAGPDSFGGSDYDYGRDVPSWIPRD